MSEIGKVADGNGLDAVPVTVEAFHRTGFRVTFATTAAKVDGVVAWLQKRGFKSQRGFETTPDGTPICPKHNIPMRKREKQGDSWYSHNMGTEDTPIWCKGYRHRTSPGWELGNS